MKLSDLFKSAEQRRAEAYAAECEAIRARLAATLKPNPGLRKKRLAQMSPERAERYLRNIRAIGVVE